VTDILGGLVSIRFTRRALVGGALALPFTMGLLSSSFLTSVALYWPVLFLLAALTVLPRAIRDRAG